MNGPRLHFLALVGLLAATGVAAIVYQHVALGFPFSPEATEQTWTVETRIAFDAVGGRPIKASLFIPPLGGDALKLEESFVSRNYGRTVERDGPNRRVVWSIRRARGRQTLYYRVTFDQSEAAGLAPPAHRGPEVEPPAIEGAEHVAIQAMLDSIRRRSADIETFTVAALQRLGDRRDHNARLLLHGDRSAANVARTAVAILHSSHIPAEIVHAIPLRESSEVEPRVLVASDNGQRWSYYDPLRASRVDAAGLLLWWEGDQPLLEVEGGSRPSASFAVVGAPVASLYLAQRRAELSGTRWLEFSLLSLPLEMQQVYEILVMMPVGVAVIVALRTFVGLDTFGTFMPALIALAFRETRLAWGMTLFSLLIAIGMVARAYLDHLRLLLVPRLAFVLTVVVMTMGLISIVSHKLGLERGLSVALLPMVIVTMTIERMSIVWEERGAGEAVLVALGSLLSAALAYLTMNEPHLSYLFFTFPGALLLLLAGFLLAGAYRGFRLAELWRFRELARE